MKLGNEARAYGLRVRRRIIDCRVKPGNDDGEVAASEVVLA
jgi:hypothetical protein